MNFQKFVHRSTKGIMLGIVIIMIVPLVLWGYMGGGGPETDGGGDAGIIFGSVNISKSTFTHQKQRAVPSYYYRLYRQQPRMAFMAMQGMRLPEAKSDELVKVAWRNIALLEDARQKGIPPASQPEMRQKSEELFNRTFFGRIPHNDETVAGVARQLFGSTVAVYDAWIADLVVIDKLLDMMSGSEFEEYGKVYDRVIGDQQSVRVTVAGFDPKEYVKELKPARTEEIAKYYQDNKIKFKTSDKVMLAYLMADVDEIKKKAPEPTEDEIKKYYEDHKSEFQKPAEHKHAPGEDHKEDEKPPVAEQKGFAEVRGEIPDKIKKRWAEDKAQEVMSAANTALGQAFVANGNKYPDNILTDLKEKFAREKGVDLVSDLTSSFDRKHVDEIEKVLGTGGGIDGWAFDAKRAEGEISQIVPTSKGRLLLKLQKKIAGSENPGVTVQNRENIVKELQKEQLRKRAQSQASSVVEEIKVHGIAGARVKYPVEWRPTRYFKTGFSQGDPSGDDPGLEDKALGNAIRSRVGQGKMKSGEALILQGSMIGREKQDWSYVIHVDDVLSSPPADFDGKFQEVRREMNGAARDSFQETYANKVLFDAAVNDLINKKDPSSAPSAPMPPPVPMPDPHGDH
ncbi:MAG TPA: hypothetical protein VJB14_01980 [Planctomycetota bacterium]|nr:hypothetical protein [Planctomycetota bacterium]